ncbi:MAG: DNA-packaging protein [Oscillospiraceae bacterium]|nr:DNA-packaging protein [Oscillospiraceae bacterium]
MRVSKKLIEFEEKIDAYFLKCELGEIYPDEAGLILHLGISREVYEKYRDNEGGAYGGFSRVLESARLRRESVITRGIYSSSGSSGRIFLARQPANGGLSDKLPPDNKKLSIEVLLNSDTPGAFD